MKKIFVPTDFSDCADKAVKIAGQIAKYTDASIHLFHVIQLPFDWVSLYVETDERYAEVSLIINQAREKMEKWVNSELFQSLENVNWSIDFNKTVYDIVKEADLTNSDLIVMGTHGASGWKDWIIGSNTQKVIRMANCPVLAVPEKAGDFDPKKVLVASDFSNPDGMQETINITTDFTEVYSADIVLLKVLTSYDDENFEIGPWQELVDYEIATVDVFKITDNQTVEGTILGYAQAIKADMIVMETHGRRGIARFFMGNLSEEIANHASIPVLVTRYHHQSSEKVGKVKKVINVI